MHQLQDQWSQSLIQEEGTLEQEGKGAYRKEGEGGEVRKEREERGGEGRGEGGEGGNDKEW